MPTTRIKFETALKRIGWTIRPSECDKEVLFNAHGKRTSFLIAGETIVFDNTMSRMVFADPHGGALAFALKECAVFVSKDNKAVSLLPEKLGERSGIFLSFYNFGN